MQPEITVPVVSHRQNRMVNALLGDLHSFCARRVVLTLTDDAALETSAVSCSVEKIRNASPKAFGVRLTSNPFEPLLEIALQQNVGAVAPLVRSPRETLRTAPGATPLYRCCFGGSSVPSEGRTACGWSPRCIRPAHRG